MPLFSLLSADPFEPFMTKNSTPMYCHIVFLNYGVIWIELSEGNTTDTDILEVQCRFNVMVTLIATYAGRNLLKKNLEHLGSLGQPNFSVEGIESNAGIKVLNNLRDANSRVMAENMMKLAKGIMRRLFLNTGEITLLLY